MVSRRKVLTNLGTGSLVLVAGCSQSDNIGSGGDSSSSRPENVVKRFLRGYIENNVEQITNNLHQDSQIAVEQNTVEEINMTKILEAKNITSEQFISNQISYQNGNLLRNNQDKVAQYAQYLNEKIVEFESENGYEEYAIVNIAARYDYEKSYESRDFVGPDIVSVKEDGQWKVLNFARPALHTQLHGWGDGERNVDILQTGGIVGDNTTNNSQIDKMKIFIRLAAGSDQLDAAQATYTFITDTSTVDIGGDGVTNGIEYRSRVSVDEGETVLTDQEDVLVVEIDLTQNDTMNQLDSNQDIMLVVNSPKGGQYYTTLQTPEEIQSGESYVL
jgi:hypothetical protein